MRVCERVCVVRVRVRVRVRVCVCVCVCVYMHAKCGYANITHKYKVRTHPRFAFCQSFLKSQSVGHICGNLVLQ